ncbi:uncharacterized protein LOC135598325 [Musa acuminata AAA Group]|uniref:(wild Malaysian banana) hypothetical protein n=1 Tax=Musa acuminata subsp. malaccensis TaxID=214687 RepID=A0A804HQB3_MUSAM|nr:PREDICTED: golgin subfamily A member 6-like protein 22 [Musa acuminata subsp. malaccensis]CAG1858565.1 unnamed protein product [Musa acuminata subsp. malaccensis]
MGGVTSKCSYAKHRKKTKELRAKVLALEEEIKEMKRVREHEARAFERHAAAFASKEAEWEQERRKHREEASKLGKRLKEEEDRIRCLEEEMAAGRGDKEWFRLGTDYLVEHMKEEQARREEAVEKWKQLYLAIKTELDDLIQRTRQGERLYLGDEEGGTIERLQKEVKAKEETAETLRSRVDEMEKEACKRDREIDILRQSLRILSNKKRGRIGKNQLRDLH